MRGTLLKSILIGSAIAAVVVQTASAADRWLEVEPAVPGSGDEVMVRLYQGPPFDGTVQPVSRGDGRVFQRLWRAGRANLGAVEDATQAARFAVSDPGVELVAYSDPASETYCKAVFVVGEPAVGDPLRWSELGQRLEIVPQSDPVELIRRGGTLEVQVLFEREPLAGARVVAIPAAAPESGLQAAISDEIGLARLKLNQAGPWMIRVRHRLANRSATATLTLYAGQPR